MKPAVIATKAAAVTSLWVGDRLTARCEMRWSIGGEPNEFESGEGRGWDVRRRSSLGPIRPALEKPCNRFTAMDRPVEAMRLIGCEGLLRS